MTARRRWMAALSAIALVLGLLAATPVLRQLLFGGPADVSIQPRFASPLGESGDPLVVMIGFPWAEDGYCSGQFQVKATETPMEVRVGTVISRTYSRVPCAGIGTYAGQAWAELTLRSPLGARTVIRASDGVVLPVFATQASLPCQSVIASEAEPPADQTVVLDQVGLPRTALQAHPSGEVDPSARLFAKVGLHVVSDGSFELSVPDEWIGRVTMGWGSPATRTINFDAFGCKSTASQGHWLVLAGGFWVGERACVPLLVKVRSQVQRVQIGVGTACPGQPPPPTL